MSKIIMTQPLCAAGYEPLAKEGEIYVANNGNPSDYLDKLADALAESLAESEPG